MHGVLGSLGGHVVHNLAIRHLADVEFDVILLEFSLNGHNGLTTLVKRLQYRYPDTAFVPLGVLKIGD